MKQRLFIGLMGLVGLFGGVNVMGQEWKQFIVEADQMLGVREHATYVYNNGDWIFSFNSENNSWSIKGEAFKPDPTHVNHRQNFETYARIGFYDDNDKMLSVFENCRLELTDIYRRATSNASKKKNGQYIVNDYLRNSKGYVRIIIPTIQGGIFDAMVPCMNE